MRHGRNALVRANYNNLNKGIAADRSYLEAFFDNLLYGGNNVLSNRFMHDSHPLEKDDILTVFRYRKPGKRGIMPAASVSYYNRIDIGIYLCILDVCMLEKGARFEREVFLDSGGEGEFTKVAVYRLNMAKNRKADD